MKPELILHADILDIIFENRNKEYGAYDLRRNYSTRMKKAMAGVFFFVSIIFVLNYVKIPGKNGSQSFVPLLPDIMLKEYEIEPDLPKPLEQPKQKPATIDYRTPIIVNEKNVDPIPDITELAKDVAIGDETIDGPPASTVETIIESTGNGTAVAATPVVPEEDKILRRAEIMPEFPGGQAAFIRFLSKNLRVPENVLEPGQKVIMIVRFVVGKDGEISQFLFLQTSGEVFEQEVLRVMKKMPKWKPGSQNGEKVQVYFNLPIIFDVPEE